MSRRPRRPPAPEATPRKLAYGKQYRLLRKAILGSRPLCSDGCGRIATEVDHVIPVRDGGRAVPGNLEPVCHSCNCKRRDRHGRSRRKRRQPGPASGVLAHLVDETPRIY